MLGALFAAGNERCCWEVWLCHFEASSHRQEAKSGDGGQWALVRKQFLTSSTYVFHFDFYLSRTRKWKNQCVWEGCRFILSRLTGARLRPVFVSTFVLSASKCHKDARLLKQKLERWLDWNWSCRETRQPYFSVWSIYWHLFFYAFLRLPSSKSVCRC